jgi:zinc protease
MGAAWLVWMLAQVAAPVAGATSPPVAPPPAAAAPAAPKPVTVLAPPPPVLAPPSPKPIDRAGWIVSTDYPAAARRLGLTGVVTYMLDVDAQGAVVACRIVRSSGAALLDTATCDLLPQRARFEPARDPQGRAFKSFFAGTVRWALPSSPLTALPAMAGRRLPGAGLLPLDLGPGPLPRPVMARAPVPLNLPPPPVDVAEDAAPPADPAVHYGRLPNGLRYAVMRRPTSVAGVAIRLQVAAGSLDETDQQRGYAHLVEHMLFRGSAHVPDGQFVKSLERMGMTLGRDTSAFTMPESTLFVLDFPNSAVAPTRTGLGLLREMVERATLAPEALASERGVVLSERRLRDDPGLRSEVARIAFLLPGQPVPERWSVGTYEGITGATAAGLRAFYEAHYRPETVTLVVAGNVEYAQVEAEIAAAFGDWQGKGPAPAKVDQGHVQPRAAQVHLEVAPGAAPVAEINWVADYDRAPDTLARGRRVVSSLVAATVLNTRLARLSDESGTPFVSADVQSSQLFHSALVCMLSVVPKPGQTGAALAAALVEQRRLVQFGIAPDEFAQAVTSLRPRLTRLIDSAAVRDLGEIANAILNDLNHDTVFTTPAQSAADSAKLLDTLTVAMAEAGAQRLFGGAGPLAYVSADSAPPGGEAGLREALAAAARQPLTAPLANRVPVWPYARFGTPGRVAARMLVPDLGVTIVRYANGTSLTIKPIPAMKDQILANLNFGSGLAGLPRGLERAHWQAISPSLPFIAGGLGKLGLNDVTTVFSGHRVGIGYMVSDDRFMLTGETSIADLDNQMQLMTAYVADPGFRAPAFDKARAIAQTQLGQADATATAAMQRDLTVLLAGGDRRWSPSPTPADLAASRPEDLPALFRAALAGPLNLVLVGDIDVARAITLGAATIGALPPRGARPPKVEAKFPAAPAEPVIVTDHGKADDAVAVAAWPTPGFFPSTRDSRSLQVMAEIMRLRLQDGLRAKDGVTYSPQAFTGQSTVFDSYGLIAASVELNPDKAARFFDTIGAIAADLAANPVKPDELNRARAPMLDEGHRRLRVTTYWVSELVGADDDPRIFDTIRTRLPDLNAVTAEDIQRLARKYLGPVRPYRLVFRAGPTP